MDSSIYKHDACDLAAADGFDILADDSICAKYHVKDSGNAHSLRNALRPECTAAESAMFPVWFLSYRKGDRVAYAVVNGQTGKAAADLPVDRRKYIIGSLLLAVPLFALLNLRFTITPAVALILSALLSFVCILLPHPRCPVSRKRRPARTIKAIFTQKSKIMPTMTGSTMPESGSVSAQNNLIMFQK